MYTAEFDSKRKALEEIFDVENIKDRWPVKKIEYTSLLDALSKPEYNLKNELGISAETVSRLLSVLFPDRKKSNIKVCKWLLAKYDLQACVKCNKVYLLEHFHSNASRTYGRQIECKLCFNDSVRDYRREYTAGRRASKLYRTPAWADLDKIKSIYDKCPKGMHVDHIIPLQGIFVSGLHVENNLQYLRASDNIAKSNKFTPE